MDSIGRGLGIGTVLLGGLAVLLPSFLGSTGFGRNVGGYGAYGGMMGSSGGMMGGSGGMMGGSGGLAGTSGLSGANPLIGILSQFGMILLLIGGGYLVYRWVASQNGAGGIDARDSARDELRRAYARGDLTEEEFEQRRTTLRMESDR